MSQETIALLGFGDIARRLLALLPDDDVIAVKRSPMETSAHLVLADCRDQGQMNQLMTTHFDVLVMSFVPTQYDDQGYKEGYVDTVKAILQALKQNKQQPRLLVFVSSTSVYGQQEGVWIDEHSPTEPNGYSGKRLLEAEQLSKDSCYDHCCVRFSGIYGPGRRRLIEQVIAGHGTPAQPVLYSNRIHADDCAGFLAYLVKRHRDHPIDSLYLASDSEPTPLYTVKQFIAERLGFDQAHLDDAAFPPARMLRSSKRCSNKRMLSTGYTLRYPTFREGYGKLLEDEV